MAEGDISNGSIAYRQSADSFVVDFDSGPRSGERWTVRDSTADAYEPGGPNRYLGQGAMEAAAEAGFGAGDRIQIGEVGLDQYGRLTGRILREVDGSPLSMLLVDDGFASSMTRVDNNGTAVLERTDPRTGDGSPADLVIDTTQP